MSNAENITYRFIETRTEVARLTWTTRDGTETVLDYRSKSEAQTQASGMKPLLTKGHKLTLKLAHIVTTDAIEADSEAYWGEAENIAEMEAALGSEINDYFGGAENVPTLKTKIVETITVSLLA